MLYNIIYHCIIYCVCVCTLHMHMQIHAKMHYPQGIACRCLTIIQSSDLAVACCRCTSLWTLPLPAMPCHGATWCHHHRISPVTVPWFWSSFCSRLAWAPGMGQVTPLWRPMDTAMDTAVTWCPLMPHDSVCRLWGLWETMGNYIKKHRNCKQHQTAIYSMQKSYPLKTVPTPPGTAVFRQPPIFGLLCMHLTVANVIWQARSTWHVPHIWSAPGPMSKLSVKATPLRTTAFTTITLISGISCPHPLMVSHGNYSFFVFGISYKAHAILVYFSEGLCAFLPTWWLVAQDCWDPSWAKALYKWASPAIRRNIGRCGLWTSLRLRRMSDLWEVTSVILCASVQMFELFGHVRPPGPLGKAAGHELNSCWALLGVPQHPSHLAVLRCTVSSCPFAPRCPQFLTQKDVKNCEELWR